VARRPIIAIDGPAGSGKSTTAAAVARALGYTHFDSGAVYRAVALVALGSLGPPETWAGAAVAGAAGRAPVAVHAGGGRFVVLVGGAPPGDALRSDAVTQEVSRVAAMAEVRDFVNGLLRSAAVDGGVVMDGRDIGTVVFPDAEVKVFLVADPEERARRRLRERGRTSDSDAIAMEAGALQARDRRDSTRAVAPLVQATGAVLIDTTALAFEEQVRQVIALARAATFGVP
jgi:cytidylate kinase